MQFDFDGMEMYITWFKKLVPFYGKPLQLLLYNSTAKFRQYKHVPARQPVSILYSIWWQSRSPVGFHSLPIPFTIIFHHLLYKMKYQYICIHYFQYLYMSLECQSILFYHHTHAWVLLQQSSVICNEDMNEYIYGI